jgi:hypothetical protein
VALKIGGCEAVRDLIEAKQYGVDYVIAPMVETPFALSKYIAAKNKIFSAEERAGVGFLFNVETISAFERIDEMMVMALQEDGASGVVFGRVDFSGSLGLPRSVINDQQITDYVVTVAEKAKVAGLELVTGGGVNSESISALRRVRSARLDRFETRKVVFDGAAIESNEIEAGLALAIDFELLWLNNKREYYRGLSAEDEKRIAMLEQRAALVRAAA